MRIGGFVDISTKDIPKCVSMVIFTVGCNFKCGYCHNKQLLQLDAGQEYTIEDLIAKITFNDLVGSISITGGEPTLQKEIVDLYKALSELNKYLSIDTNGSKPAALRKLMPYLDRVALDIKAPFNAEKLCEVTGVNVDPEKLKKSFFLLNKQEKLDFEIRTTYEPNLLQPEDIHEILEFLQTNKFGGKFVLQQYQYNEGVQEEFKDKFEKPPHFELVNILKPYAEKECSYRIFLRDEAIGYEEINKAMKKFED
ncbi:MAG: anaerobic ribonucleoside-triphosphate reductase activating protein [Promethearchaeia archaeon]